MSETLRFDRLETPIGTVALVADPAGCLRAVGFTEGHGRMERLLSEHAGGLVRAFDPGGLTSALRAYFDGDLGALDGLPVAPRGTPFETEVWRALREIPCGETRSYGELARRIGRPTAVRAVGAANGKNPIGIVVPCHRVIGANGALTGFAGGVERKRWLLDHERRFAPGAARA